MKVAITGASGMLGRFVARAVAREHDVVALDLAANPDRPSTPVDVGDFEGVKRAMTGCDAVIHLAALDQARPASEQQFFAVNAVGAWNVLLAAEELGMRRAVLCSSVAALGLRVGAPPQSLPIPVDHEKTPVSAYGASKQATELAGECFARRGKLTVTCLRPALVTFPHQIPEWVVVAAEADGLPPPAGAPAVLERVQESLPLTCAWVAPEDAAEAFLAALTADLPPFSAFFVTAADTMSSRATPIMVADRLAANPPITRPALYQTLPQASLYDLEPARAALGWTPKLRWGDMVARIVTADAAGGAGT